MSARTSPPISWISGGEVWASQRTENFQVILSTVKFENIDLKEPELPRLNLSSVAANFLGLIVLRCKVSIAEVTVMPTSKGCFEAETN